MPPTEVDILSPEHHHFDDIPFMICKKTKKCMLLLCICDTCYVDDDVDDTILYYTLLYCSLWSIYRSRWWSTCFVLGCQKGSKDDEKDIFSCYVLLLLHNEGSNTFWFKIPKLMEEEIQHLHLSLFNRSCSLHFLILWLISVKILS